MIKIRKKERQSKASLLMLKLDTLLTRARCSLAVEISSTLWES